MSKPVLLKTEFKDLALFRRGKVRDVYDLGENLLIISTDRISCFDVVLPSGIPDKGKVLTGLSVFWFDFIKEITRHHLITVDVDKYPPELNKYKADLAGRSMLVLKTKPLPVECVVRGYLSGSGWKEYQQKQSVCGISLPGGLRESEKLPEIIFTPSTKAEQGHDQNINQKYVEDLVGVELASRLKKISIAIYKLASAYALSKGIIIADTKFEFGLYQGQLIIIDEVLTPDSSRFWPLDQYQPGKVCPSFDKQFVRDYLETLDWNKTLPAPALPEEVINITTEKYLEAYRKLTSKTNLI
ncbi:MAG: phosphoribosylaminoimidazolesuccinocarboxamide synthase [Candidatus Omnitrophica bacterium]|nr:phosphoribosylaminoimidazolesuccinocarboxamide synthase [Candidatus Omnitrophota bacterium]MBU4303577.1 phosphoribosylaminoimidazolesuccinocarboxamide synthase [Candidatus Omnitrophota bacterium]MBU4467142.1 phosphoribosylaminoimidazolesuccinocarboxamide synthase [Candidatus Omnitrophota bacterium]MCG2708343.1 phosphoribosylaminoimidazolesuccinocarboxamide synthase [Candidatus Omnitrophota bacterium]